MRTSVASVFRFSPLIIPSGTDISDRSPSESPHMASNTGVGNVRNALRKYVIGSTLDVGKAVSRDVRFRMSAITTIRLA